MLCVWWDHHDIHFKFLNHTRTLNADLYFQRVHENLVMRRNLVLYDNARPNSTRITQEKILDLGWTLLPYSLDLVSSNFHFFFCSLQNVLLDKKYFEKELVKTFAEDLNSKLSFTKEESTSYLIKRWFKIMVNILLIEMNSLLNYSWINYILLKQKLIMTQVNNNDNNVNKQL